MKHVQHEVLQRYLTGEVEQTKPNLIESHLALCDECRSVMEALAAEDLHLRDALLLGQSDSDWIASLDLWPAVKGQITPWYRQPQGYLLILALLVACGWVLDQTMPLVVHAVLRGGPVALLVRCLRTLVPALIQFLNYLDRGGILANIWPLLLLIGTVFMTRKGRSYSNA